MSRLDEYFINLDHIADEKVSAEWRMFELSGREGFLAAYNSERSVRLLAGILIRVDKIDLTLERIAISLKLLSYCAVIGLVLAAISIWPDS